MRNLLFLFIAILLLPACTKHGGSTSSGIIKNSVVGANGEILIVINDAVKNDTAGLYLQDMLTDDYLGLAVPEPIFDIQTVPFPYFSGQMQKFRNIIMVNVNDTVSCDTIRYYDNVWADPQAVISVQAKSCESLLPMLQRHHIKIVSYITLRERQRLMAFNERTRHLPLSEEIGKKWDLKITIPNTFDKCNPPHPDDLSWVQINTDVTTTSLLIYSFPYVGEGTFSREYLLNKRDGILRNNIEGPAGSFMCTEIRFGLDEILYKSGTYKGNDVVELRGLWRMEGYAMGGPFLMRAIHDKARNRVVVLDGFVYYPSKEKKRNQLRQLEAVMYSVDFPEVAAE